MKIIRIKSLKVYAFGFCKCILALYLSIYMEQFVIFCF